MELSFVFTLLVSHMLNDILRREWSESSPYCQAFCASCGHALPTHYSLPAAHYEKRFALTYHDYEPVPAQPSLHATAQIHVSTSSLAVDLANKYDSDLHVFHLTTEKEMDLFSAGAIDGKKITSEVCVHHMFFNQTHYSKLGNQIKCNPSIKSESDRLALIKSLLEDKIDISAEIVGNLTEFFAGSVRNEN